MKETNQDVIELRDESMSSETFTQIILAIFIADIFTQTEKTSFRFSPQLIIFKLQAFINIDVISWRGRSFSLNLISAGTAIFAQLPKSMA